MAQWTLNYTTYDNSQWTSVVGNIGAGGGEFQLYNLPWTEENLPDFKDIELNIGTVENLATWRIDNSGTYLNIRNVWPNIQTANIYNTAKVINMSNIFAFCDNLISVTNMDTSNVINMSSMFSKCYNLTNIPNFDTSNVTDMSSMFYNCDNLTIIPNFDTSNVTDMYRMFGYCSNLTVIPNINTLNVTNMYYIFGLCYNLINIPNFNTSNVKHMNYMFYHCRNLTNIPNLNTINVTDMRSMFSNCTNLTTIFSFDTSNIIKMSSMFRNCYNLSNQSLKNIAKSLPNVSQLTSQNNNLQNIGLSQNQINYISTTKYASQLQARGWNIEDNYVKPDLVKSLKMKQSDGTMNLAMLGTNAEYVDMEDGTTLEETVQNLKQYIDDNVANILGGMY